MSQAGTTQNSSAMIRTLVLIATISGLLVVMVFELTRPIIAENQRIAVEQAIFQVIPSAAKWEEYRLSDEKLLPATESTDGISIYAGFNQKVSWQVSLPRLHHKAMPIPSSYSMAIIQNANVLPVSRF